MKTVRVSDLEGAALDWAVAKAVGHTVPDTVYYSGVNEHGRVVSSRAIDLSEFSPSTDWSQCGPLIEGRIVFLSLNERMNRRPDGWSCLVVGTRGVPAFGETPLIASCRAIVAANIGDEVDVPDELVETA